MSVLEFTSHPTTAEGWCARLHADDVTESERAAFNEWVGASPERRAEYELTALTMAVSGGMKNFPELHAAPRAAPVRVSRKLAIAAGIALAVLASGWFVWRSSIPRYSTGIGEQKTVALADGSTIQLNTASAMNVDLEPGFRHVTLRRGEAFFNIARDPARPFVVRAGQSEIRVLGTKFNVRVMGNIAHVGVLEGHVQVIPLGGSAVPAGERAAAAQALDLLPGQGASVASQQPALAAQTIDTARLTAWREGRIYFENERLSTMLEEVNRYTTTPFVVVNPLRNELRLSGIFRSGDAQSVVYALQTAYGLEVEQQGDRILVH